MADPVNYLEMSDEELLAMGPPDTSTSVPTQDDTQTAAGDAADTTADDAVASAEGTPDAAATASEVQDEGDAADDAEEPNAAGTGATAPETKAEGDDAAKVEGEEKNPTETKDEKKDEPVVDYKAVYDRLMTPFKANGREVKVESVDDAIALMQMGANYNKKMAALKPNLKVLKLLEKNQLLDETKLSFLIELQNKNPEAINKLVKDSGINPMDLDPEKAGDYKQKIHTVDDREIALDTVLDEIKDSATYTRTLGIVSKEWDADSKQVIADHPVLLKVINDHVERGIYDLVSAEVERERMLGRLTGVSDIEAYRQVGDAMQAKGRFNHLAPTKDQKTTANTPAPAAVTPKPKVDEDTLNAKRRAAAPTKPGAAPTSAKPEFNPLAMSDEEFAKISATRYR
jgi:hypothetical protein